MHATGRQPKPAIRAPDGAPLHYERHHPEQTTLYRLVQQHAASFIAHIEASTGGELRHGGFLDRYVSPMQTTNGAVGTMTRATRGAVAARSMP